MTTEQKIIRAKVGLLELAKQLGNVSQACKMMGYSRDSFYRLVLLENLDADVPGCSADGEGESDRGLTATDTKTRSLNQAPPVRCEFQLIQMIFEQAFVAISPSMTMQNPRKYFVDTVLNCEVAFASA
jgi:hypothetical protein